MGDVNHQQAELLLKLYDLRREPKLREARAWLVASPNFQSLQDLQAHCPPGTEKNAFLRQVCSYWEMCASMVNRGLIDEEFFFENTGEQWVVWERIKGAIPEMRAAFKNPHFFKNLEDHAGRLEAWREKRAPGASEAIRAYVKAMSEAAAKAKSA
jgi:hypothetical protein